MPDTPTVLTKDIIGWTVTGIGLLANLGFSLWNRMHADSQARDLRRSTFGLDEWKTHRTAILGRLDEFEAAGDQLMLLGRGEHGAVALRTEINNEGRKLAVAHEALLRALVRGGDQTWEQYGYGKYQGGESDWDRLNSTLADLGGLPDDPAVIRASLTNIKSNLRSITESVNEQVRVATAEHNPQKL